MYVDRSGNRRRTTGDAATTTASPPSVATDERSANSDVGRLLTMRATILREHPPKILLRQRSPSCCVLSPRATPALRRFAARQAFAEMTDARFAATRPESHGNLGGRASVTWSRRGEA